MFLQVSGFSPGVVALSNSDSIHSFSALYIFSPHFAITIFIFSLRNHCKSTSNSESLANIFSVANSVIFICSPARIDPWHFSRLWLYEGKQSVWCVCREGKRWNAWLDFTMNFSMNLEKEVMAKLKNNLQCFRHVAACYISDLQCIFCRTIHL